MTGNSFVTRLRAARTFKSGSFGCPSLTCPTRTRSDITSGTFMSENNLPEWEQLLSAAAHLQEILPDATLVGGTAVAIFAHHDLRNRFDEVLAELEDVAGWRTARVRRPVLILGSLDGIETGVRQLIRERPLETQEVAIGDLRLVGSAE